MAKKLTKQQLDIKIEAELDNQNFCGWLGDTYFLKYDWQKFQDFCAGQVIIGIGANNFQSAIYNILHWGMAWNEYNGTKLELQRKYNYEQA